MIVISPLDRILTQTTPASIDKARRTGRAPSAFAVTQTPNDPADIEWGAAITSIDLTAPALRELLHLLEEGLASSSWRPPCIRALTARLHSLSPSPTLVPVNTPVSPCDAACSSDCPRTEGEVCHRQ